MTFIGHHRPTVRFEAVPSSHAIQLMSFCLSICMRRFQPQADRTFEVVRIHPLPLLRDLELPARRQLHRSFPRCWHQGPPVCMHAHSIGVTVQRACLLLHMTPILFSVYMHPGTYHQKTKALISSNRRVHTCGAHAARDFGGSACGTLLPATKHLQDPVLQVLNGYRNLLWSLGSAFLLLSVILLPGSSMARS